MKKKFTNHFINAVIFSDRKNRINIEIVMVEQDIFFVRRILARTMDWRCEIDNRC